MKKLRVVQVGAGRFTHADDTMLAMRAMPDYYDVVGVCEPNEKARALAKPRIAYEGLNWLELDDVLSDHTLDALIIETDEIDQARMALRAAEAGFPIHMDKPGGEDLSAFEKLVETVKRKNLVFQSGYMLRYNPAVVKLLDLIRAGELGDILCVEAQMSPPRYSRAFAQDVMRSMKGGMAYYLGCHLMDLVYLIKGAPQEIIPMNACTGTLGMEGLDYGFVAYRYKEGTSFIKTTSSEVAGVTRRQLIVSGTKGTAEIEPLEEDCTPIEGQYKTLRVGLKASLEADDASAWTTQRYEFPPYGRYTAMMIDFARMVRGEARNAYTPEYELEVFKLLLASCGLPV